MTGFKGWHVLIASFITAMMLAGATFYSFQHIVEPFEKEFSITVSQINVGMMVFLLSAAFWAAIIGRSLNRISPKKFAVAGAIAFGIGFILISRIQNPQHMLWVVFTLIGFGFTACGPFICNVLTTNWFYKKRGRALGFAAVATSAGGFIVQPIFVYLLNELGWRDAIFWMGLSFAGLSLILALTVIVSRPEDIGQFPDGASEPIAQNIVAMDPSKILKNRDFWVIAIACGLLLGSDQALLVSLKKFGLSKGYPEYSAAAIPIVVAGSAIAGKLFVGFLVERFDKRKVFSLVCLSNIMFLLVAIYAQSFITMVSVAAIVGMAIGGIYPVWTSITADCFGREYFGPAMGFMNLITVVFAIVSMGVVGKLYDAHGNYDLAFKILIPMATLAAIVMMFVRTKQTQSKKVSS
ncbi:MAG: MFS transporter [Hellea sp.]|nr:MFS transporter [Hellea sp.]